jgi:hypothetical protein
MPTRPRSLAVAIVALVRDARRILHTEQPVALAARLEAIEQLAGELLDP